MSRLSRLACFFTVFANLAGTASAQGNPRGKAVMTLKGKPAAQVEYGRPSLKGRSVEQLLNQLPPGEIWRLGADKSTTFSTTMELVVGAITIPKGQYSLWARREGDHRWKLVFNKQHGQWGTEYDPAQDFASVPLTQTKSAKPAEMLELVLAGMGNEGVFMIRWGDMELSTEIKTK